MLFSSPRAAVADSPLTLTLRHTVPSTLRSAPDTIDLSSTLLGNLSGLQTPEDMQDVLGRIFLLLAQGRLTTKRAAVLTYTMQQLLRTVPAIEHKQEVARKAAIEADPVIVLPPHLREMVERKRRIAREAWAKNHPQEANASPDAVGRSGNSNSDHLAEASDQNPAQPAPQAQTAASTNTVSSDPVPASNTPAPVRPSDLAGFGAPANWDVLIPSKPVPRRRRRLTPSQLLPT